MKKNNATQPMSAPARDETDDLRIRLVPLEMIEESETIPVRAPPYAYIGELASSIEAWGQTTPLFVRPTSRGTYELISGYRRYAALEQLGAETALVRIFDLTEDEACDLALDDNVAHEPLDE